MTQNELAEALNVSRSTVSNWEIERNYPDIQLIVSLSKILNIPLEILLQKDSDVVKKITNDTKEKKNIKLKLKILYIILFAIIISGSIYVYQSNKYQEISNADQIIALTENWIFWCAESANPANRKAPVRHMEISTTDFQCGEAAVPGIEDILRNGAMPSVHSLIAGSRPYTSLIER